MKKLVIAAMVAAFVMSSSMVMAAKTGCTVDKIEGDQVTMTCKKPDQLKVGDNVSVKTKKGYEGC